MPRRGAWSSGSGRAAPATYARACRTRTRFPLAQRPRCMAVSAERRVAPRHPGPPVARRPSVAPGMALASQAPRTAGPLSSARPLSPPPAYRQSRPPLRPPLRHGGGHGSAGQAPVPRFFPRSLRRTLTACAEWRGDRARRLAIVPRTTRHPDSTALTCHRTPPSISSLWHDPSGRWLKRAARTVRGVLESMV
jgi:hypothetical protein